MAKLFDAADYLNSEEAITAYINAAIEEMGEPGGVDGFLLALGTVARVRGMSEIAKRAGLNRESLYKALAPGSHPQFETITAVLRALNLRVAAIPDSEHANAA